MTTIQSVRQCYRLLGLLVALPALGASNLGAATLLVSKSAAEAFRTVRAAYAEADDEDIIQVEPDLFAECAGEFLPPKRVTIVPVGGTARIVTNDCVLPANDFFSRAKVLSGNNVHGAANNANATNEFGEKHIGADYEHGAGQTVWWKWTAPTDGLAIIDSRSSEEDHLIAVYTGVSVAALVPITESFVELVTKDPVDPVFFETIAGTTYCIAFDTLEFSQGGGLEFDLSFEPSPANDAFSHRIQLNGYWASATGATRSAVFESGETNLFGNDAARKSIWWAWTAPPSPNTNRMVVISTAGSRFDTLLAVYEGNFGGKRWTNDDYETEHCTNPSDLRTLSSTVMFRPNSGTTYLIQVDGSHARKDLLVDLNGTPMPKLLVQYSGKVHLNVDYSGLNLVDECHSFGCADTRRCTIISGELRITHYGNATTQPLRVSLIASNGFAHYFNAELPTTNPAIVLTNISLAGNLQPGAAASVFYTNVNFPRPGGSDGKTGWGVFGVLEEKLGDRWFPVDSTIIVYGEWPYLAPFGGPNGGPVRSDPSQPKPAGLEYIRIQGPEEIVEGETVRFLATAYFDDDTTQMAEPDWTPSSLLSILADGTAPPFAINQDVSVMVQGTLRFSSTPFSDGRSVRLRNMGPPSLQNIAVTTNGTVRFQIRGVPGRRHVIETGTNLMEWPDFVTVTNNPNGLYEFIRTELSGRQRFYRAREVP